MPARIDHSNELDAIVHCKHYERVTEPLFLATAQLWAPDTPARAFMYTHIIGGVHVASILDEQREAGVLPVLCSEV